MNGYPQFEYQPLSLEMLQAESTFDFNHPSILPTVHA